MQRVRWQRARLLFIGHKEPGSLPSRLGIEAGHVHVPRLGDVDGDVAAYCEQMRAVVNAMMPRASRTAMEVMNVVLDRSCGAYEYL